MVTGSVAQWIRASGFGPEGCGFKSYQIHYPPVAQGTRASACGAEGRRFKSSRVGHDRVAERR